MMLNDTLSRRRFLAATGMAAGALTLPGCASARPAAPPRPPRTVELTTSGALIRALVDGGRIAGGLAALGVGDSLSTVGHGTLVRGGARTPDADTLWRIYSGTKPITGMAVMQLIEAGRLSLDQPLADILPEWANPRVQRNADTLDSRPAARPITIRNLLTHTAGLGYAIITKGPLLAEYLRLGLSPGQISRSPIPGVTTVPNAPSLAEFSKRLATLPLIADPGARWSYSVAADLLGRVVEVASGMPFDRYLQDRLLGPLGMTDTSFTVPASKIARLSTSYASLAGLLIPVDPAANSVYSDRPTFPYGGAGLVSTARDQDRFYHMLANGGELDGERVMSRATTDLALSDLLPAGADTAGTFAAGQGYGALGRVVTAPEPGGPSKGSFGWAGAAGTISYLDRGRGLRLGGYIQVLPAQAVAFQQPIVKALLADAAAASV